MIPRQAAHTAHRLAQGFPLLLITGPRQSGKTTLARALFAERPYASLENPETRDFALNDPRGFLARFPDGAVIDEVQRAPELLSYLQGQPANLYFWRNNTGQEVDVLFEEGTGLRAVEIKSGATLVNSWLRGLHRWQALVGGRALPPWLIYGGDEAYQREGVVVMPWRAVL